MYKISNMINDKGAHMQGLPLSQEYFFQVGLPEIQRQYPDYANRIAAGLVGDGSECFSFDDRFSQDHDWGPSFQIWLTPEDYAAFGAHLQQLYESLPGEFLGFPARRISDYGSGRVGVFEIGAFYSQFIGYRHPPQTIQEWRRLPEINLAAATNGKVFYDPVGKFTAFRDDLLAYYPEDVRLKKLASRAMSVAQSGQYNFLRCARRGEWVAASYAQAEFTEKAISMVFLLNKRYRPFYKWMHRALKSLPILGELFYQKLLDLSLLSIKEYEKKNDIIEELSQKIICELHRQNLTSSTSDFLLDHGPEIQKRIQEPTLRQLHVLAE